MASLDLTTAKPVEAGQSDYLLVDEQVRLSTDSEDYYRVVERLTNQDSVDEAAQISIEIDPQHERVLLHQVRVFRNGRAIDKLKDARRSLLTRESGLEDNLIDGRVTLHVLLTDVRVGDVLDYSYTLKRRDPIGERGYNDWFVTQYTDPVRRLRLRVLRPRDRPLQIVDHSALAAPTVVQKAGWSESTWEGHDIAGLPMEKDRPGWHFFRPRIELSEFADWNAVRAWAEPLYAVNASSVANLQSLLSDLKVESNESARVLRALRFVQDEIRYTGIEVGAGAYRPTPPDVVLARRYGDCKDKVLLLVTLLRQTGVRAWPALVHTHSVRGVAQRVPSPGAFNHVIAKVRLGEREYWLDATASLQGGGLDTLVQADFGQALVIDGAAHGLQEIPPRTGLEPNHHVTETYDLRKGREQPASFRVHTVYTEEEADSMRAKMLSTTTAELGKEYLEYYHKRYPGIRMVTPLAVKDDRASNVYTVDEDYEIAKPFKKKGSKWKFYFRAYLILQDSDAPDEGGRTSPLARAFPMHVRQEIVAYLPQDWSVDPEMVTISDPAFEYRSEVKFSKGRLDLTYDLRHAADNVPASSIAEFARKLEDMEEDAYYSLTDARNAGVAGAPPAPQGTKLAVLFATLVGAAGGAWLAARLARRPRWLPAARPDAPQGVRGWMLAPLMMLVSLFVSTIEALRDQLVYLGSIVRFDVPARWLMLGRAAVIPAALVLCCVALWSMYKRASAFPRIFLAALAADVLFVATSMATVLLKGIPPRIRLTAFALTGGMILVATLLAAYVTRSQRVRATFVK